MPCINKLYLLLSRCQLWLCCMYVNVTSVFWYKVPHKRTGFMEGSLNVKPQFFEMVKDLVDNKILLIDIVGKMKQWLCWLDDF